MSATPTGGPPRPRRFHPADLDGCMEVFDSNVPDFFQDAERAGFRHFLGELPGPYLVLLDPTGRIGACGGFAVDPEAGSADLCWGMVRRDLHLAGWGRALTQARIDRALADAKVDRILLNTSQHTSGFYERLGFVTMRVRPDGYGPGLDRHDMRLDARG